MPIKIQISAIRYIQNFVASISPRLNLPLLAFLRGRFLHAWLRKTTRLLLCIVAHTELLVGIGVASIRELVDLPLHAVREGLVVGGSEVEVAVAVVGEAGGPVDAPFGDPVPGIAVHSCHVHGRHLCPVLYRRPLCGLKSEPQYERGGS